MRIGLAEVQDLFAALVMHEGAVDPAWRDACFEGTAALTAAERVHVYADMYLFRLVDALREDYPLLARHLGDEAFFELCAAYVREHPSRNPSLAHLGAALPEFLRGRPALADLAALEWARAEASIAKDAETAPIEALQQLGDGIAAARLELSPSVRLVSLRHDAVALWDDLEHSRAPADVRAQPQSLLVWRSGFEVFHAPVPAEELAALRALRSGATLGETCEAFAALPDAAQAATEAVASWFGEGIIARVVNPA